MVIRSVRLGRSVKGRPIDVTEVGDPDNPAAVLVVGVVHGDEPAGRAVAARLARARPQAETNMWILGDLNPDGSAAHTRQNADGVDLNRNFPWRWRPLGIRGAQQYAGRRALSEPESRVARTLIARLRPAVTIWFHQPLGVVDLSGGHSAVERKFARRAGLPTRRLPRYPGSAAGWQNHEFASTTAFVVELPPGRLSRPATTRLAAATRRLALTQ